MMNRKMMELMLKTGLVRNEDTTISAGKLTRRVWRRYWSHILLGVWALLLAIANICVLAINSHAAEDTANMYTVERNCIEPIAVQLIPEYDVEMGEGVAEEQAISLALPDVDTSAKTFMSYKTITAKNSIQWKLQQKAVTNAYGIRELDGMYMIALGTYYSDHAGAMFRITLENGTVFDAVMGDVKDNRDTDSMNQHRNGNVVEFVVDTPKLARDARLMGDVSYTPNAGLMGPIQSIEYLGEYEL